VNITENIYLLLFFIATSVLSIVFLVLGLTYYMEYNLAIGLFTSFLTTAFTVFFLNIFLNYRKQKQWKSVKDNALFEIEMEIGAIFSEIIELVNGPFIAPSFKMTVMSTKDSNTRKSMIFSKMKEYNSTKPLKLAVNRLEPNTYKFFTEIINNLYSIHVIYGNLIDDARIVNDIINVRNALRAIGFTQEMADSFSKMKSEHGEVLEGVKKLMPDLKDFNFNNFNITEIALSPMIQKLVELVYDLWTLGIQFDQIG
jgi:hypothetical protein